MPTLRALLLLITHRARNRPARWMLTMLGIAAASAYGGAVLAESIIAGDRAERAILRALPASERVIRITASGVVTPAIEHGARSALRRLGFPSATRVVLLSPVRLGATVVRAAAIDPLAPWATPGLHAPCRASNCPMLALDAGFGGRTLKIPGLRVSVLAQTQLKSSAPLGFSAGVPGLRTSAGQPPVLLTGDASGLERIAALSGVYRTQSWFAPLSAGMLHAWQLAALQSRLQRSQSALAQGPGNLTLSAPFSALAAARSRADSLPGRLLLAGGGAIAALALFLALAAGALRQDQASELERLRNTGARSSTLLGLVVGEALLVSAGGVLAGAAVALGVGSVLARAAGMPAATVLDHSLLTPAGLTALGLGWLGASGLVILLLTQRRPGLADAAALAAIAALALAMIRGDGGGGAFTILLAPLVCLAGGVLIARTAAVGLRAGERLARAGPPLARLAFVGLARAPLAPSLGIAFLAVSTAIGGFALAYRATLARGSADQAADRVPLDALVAASPDFTAPLALTPLARWRMLSGGSAFEIRRADATYLAGSSSATVPALGVPAAAVSALHGWRAGDGSISLQEMARAIVPPGPSRVPGPMLPSSARVLTAGVSTRGAEPRLIADLRGGDGQVRQLRLGVARGRGGLRASLPPGRWELEALELHEPTGLEITNGHQNGENVAAATQATATVSITVQARDPRGRDVLTVDFGHWRAVGAAAGLRFTASGARLRFSTTGVPGVLRPAQPSDRRPIPMLADPGTAAAADAQGRLELTIDGAPVAARVVAVLRRFPTLPPESSGFVVADQSSLAGALDAWLPGQGRSDELWLTSPRSSALRHALQAAPLSHLSSQLRVDVERGLQADGVARAVQGSLLAAALLSACLAVIGVLVSLLGSGAQERVSADLSGQGVSARALRNELRLRSLFTAVAGCLAGFVLALGLTPLAVSAVRSAAQIGAQRPPLVAVTPWVELTIWMVVVLGAVLLAVAAGVLRRGRTGASGG